MGADAGADALVAVSETGADAASAEAAVDPRALLFVGNSYVFVNDVAGRVRALSGRRVEQVTAGGYRLEQHAADARRDATPLAQWLRTGECPAFALESVVLQEQSQIGGFPATTSQRVASVAAAIELAALARARGARVVLYMTWGRRDGDPDNAGLGFDTFEGMESALEEGYRSLASQLRARGNDVRVAPVGGAFRTVYEDASRAGGDPHAASSDFVALYESDGSHPSPRGAWLAACVLTSVLTGRDAASLGDDAALGPAVSMRLRDACARALRDPRWSDR